MTRRIAKPSRKKLNLFCWYILFGGDKKNAFSTYVHKDKTNKQIIFVCHFIPILPLRSLTQEEKLRKAFRNILHMKN